MCIVDHGDHFAIVLDGCCEPLDTGDNWQTYQTHTFNDHAPEWVVVMNLEMQIKIPNELFVGAAETHDLVKCQDPACVSKFCGASCAVVLQIMKSDKLRLSTSSSFVKT
jgi:hypothetical protein